MICIWCACFTKRALASYSPPLSHKEDFKERLIETTQIQWLTFSFSTLGLFIPRSQLHLLHRHNREGEKVTQHLSHARQTGTKTPSGEAMLRPTKLRGFHSVSVADRFSRWFQDGVSSVRRGRREEKPHTLILIKINNGTAAVCVSQVCRSTAAAGLLAQAGRTSRTGCGTRTAAT